MTDGCETAGACPPQCSTASFCLVPSLPSGTTNLTAVWGSDATHVWVVGYAGTILQWNNQTWAVQPSGTSADLTGVGGTDADHVWVLEALGPVLLGNGVAWVSLGGPPFMLWAYAFGIWGSAPNNIWTVGNMLGIAHWNGTTWTEQMGPWPPHYEPVTGQYPYEAVWGSDANHAWAVGSYVSFVDVDGFEQVSSAGTVAVWNGVNWSESASFDQWLHGVWGSDVNNVWAVGSSTYGTDSLIVKWDGMAWSSQASGTTNDLYGVWGSDADHVWAVGAAGTIVQWNGTAWTTLASGTKNNLRAIWGSGANNLWIVGDNGTILHKGP